MKRIQIVVVAAGALLAVGAVVAVSGGHVGSVGTDDATRAAPTASSPPTPPPVDVSRPLSHELLDRQAAAQAQRLFDAQQDLADQVERQADDLRGRQELRVTIREVGPADGVCGADLAVRVPQAASYRLGVAIEGRGISSPSDPGETTVEAGPSPQSVVVRR